jgi:hypothetical protein
MKKGLVFVLMMTACVACSSGDKKIPKDVLPVDKMKVIIWDLTQAGSYAVILEEKDTSRHLNTMYMAEVLKMHHITKKDFFKSFNFYQSDPSLNKILFDSVSAYAQRQRGVIYKRYQ